MHNEHTFVDNVCEWKPVEALFKQSERLGVKFIAHLLFKPVSDVVPLRLVIASIHEDVVRVGNLHGCHGQEYLAPKSAAIDKISVEQVVIGL